VNFCDANCSSVLAKVRSKAKVIVEDNAIEENTSDGDLFGSKAASLRASRKAEAASPQLASSTSKTSADLFSEQYAFVWDRLGPNPTYNSPQIRANALRRILHHSQKDPAQLDRFAELVAKWRANGRSIDRETTLEFIDRCIFRHPTLLIQVFSHHVKFGMDIPDIKEARRILRALVIKGKTHLHPEDALQDTVSFAALYPVYGFQPASTDLTSCTLLAQACSQVMLRKSPAEGETPSEQKPNSAPLVSVIPDLLRTLRSSGSRTSQESDTSQLSASLQAEARQTGHTQSMTLERMWVAAGLREIHRGLLKIGYSRNSAQGSRSSVDIIKEASDAHLVPTHA